MQTHEASPPEKLWKLATWLLGHAGVDARRLVAQAFGHSTGRTDLDALARLDQSGSLNKAALGRRPGTNLGDLVSVLKRLEADGSVERRPHPEDRRRNTIEITASGWTAMSELKAVDAAQDELLESLSQSERQQLVALLQRSVERHRDYRRNGASNQS